jgi:hypothetical protein
MGLEPYRTELLHQKHLMRRGRPAIRALVQIGIAPVGTRCARIRRRYHRRKVTSIAAGGSGSVSCTSNLERSGSPVSPAMLDRTGKLSDALHDWTLRRALFNRNWRNFSSNGTVVDMNWTRFSTARFSAVTLPPMPCTISRTIDNPSPVQGPGLMSWLGDGVASPPTRMRGTHRAYGCQRSRCSAVERMADGD